MRRAVLGLVVVLGGSALLAGQAPAPVMPGVLVATHYIAPGHPAATDEGNPAGTVLRPRRTIPNPVPAGSVVELGAGEHATAYTSPRTLRLEGTETARIVLRSASRFAPATVTGGIEVTGAYYTIENLKFTGGVVFIAPNAVAVFRDNEIVGIPSACRGVAVFSHGTAWNREVAIYRNWIHDNGDVQASFDQDCHGIGVGSMAERIYLYQNTLERNSGDGVQINGGIGGQQHTRMIFVVQNTARFNKQHGLWTKQATDVVFLQNVVSDHRPSNSSLGACMGMQYGPEHVWFLENDLARCDYGIQVASELASPLEGLYVLIQGNRIADIADTNASDTPGNLWNSCGVSIMGRQPATRYLIGNSVRNAPRGFCLNAGTTYEGGNVVDGVATPVVGTTTPVGFEATRDALLQYYRDRYR